jgi:hypothetical protein
MRIVLIVMLLCTSVFTKAQSDSTVFAKQKEVATSEYVFMVPNQWTYIPGIDISSKDRKYEFTGVGIPKEFNHFTVTGTLNLRKYDCSNINAAEDYVVTEITSYPDRVTPPGRNYETDSLKILSGEKAILFSTRFFRHTKVSNYSRFDLVVYSKKRKAAYMFTILVQYHDSTYAFETKYNLRQYALKVFSSITLR